jgi:RND family efflux transporter MFP subunit
LNRLALYPCPLLVLSALAFGAGSDDTGVVIAEPAMRVLTLTGFTRARAELPLVAETQGRIQSVAYDIGDAIGSDGTFARIDDTFVRLEIEQNTVRQEQLRSQIAFDEREAERYEKLARQNNAAASQRDTFEQTLLNNRNALRQLDVQQRVLAERLRRTRVPAPAGWRVTERRVEPGQWVSVGERLGAVADFTALLVPFALTPAQHAVVLAESDTDRGLRLELPDLNRTLRASVYRSNPGFDPDTRKVGVELKLDEPIQPLRGGLRVMLKIAMPERSGAVLLPAAAVRESYEEYWVDPVDGEPIQVLLLGRHDGPDGPRLRVSSPRIRPGDRFLMSGPHVTGGQPLATRP